jgi:hypothetical protein
MKNAFIVIIIICSTIKLFSQENVKNPFSFFKGYKVDTAALRISRENDRGKSYWKNVGIPGDLIVDLFQSKIGFFQGIAFGDFNTDGWIDIFNAGSRYEKTLSISTFLIWNPKNNLYESRNLFKNPSDSIFGGNKNKTISIFLNDDNYTDFIIFDNGDEYFLNSINEPIRLVLSDGKGGYELSSILTNENEPLQNMNKKEGGDVGDLNGDGIIDLVICCGEVSYIYWGKNAFPYFDTKNRICFQKDNGFGEVITKATISYDALIIDIDKNGEYDIIMTGEASPSGGLTYIMMNKGNGKFTDSAITYLPRYNDNQTSNEDFEIDDLNQDGLNDIIALNKNGNNLNWNFAIYFQNKDKTYFIDTSYFEYKINTTIPRYGRAKFMMFYKDLNQDGKKDIGYFEGADNENQFDKKTIFLRDKNKFIEHYYFEIDSFVSQLIKYSNYSPITNSNSFCKFIQKPEFLRNEIEKYYGYGHCKGDSTLMTVKNIFQKEKLYWYQKNNTDSISQTVKHFKDSAKVYVLKEDSLGCRISSDTVNIEIRFAPNSPPIMQPDTSYCQFAKPLSLKANPFSQYGLTWYGTSETGGKSDTVAPFPKTDIPGTFYYYVSQHNYYERSGLNSGEILGKGCEGPRGKIKVVIIAAPEKPDVKDISFCLNSQTDTLKASTLSNHIPVWYGTDSSNINPSYLSNRPNSNIAGIVNYFVSQKSLINGCESIKSTIKVTVHQLPNAPSVRDTAYCINSSADTLRVIPSTGNSILWYGNNQTGGIGNTTAIKPNTSTVGVNNFYLSQYNPFNGCESSRSRITITVKEIPQTPTLFRDAENFLVSSSSGTRWYKDGNEISDTAQKIKPSSQGSYSAKILSNGCLSLMSAAYYYLVSGWSNLNTNESIDIFPNPSNNQIYLTHSINGYSKLNVDIIDIVTSKIILSIKNINSGTTIPLQNLFAGTYIFKISSIDKKVLAMHRVVKL